MDTQGIKQMNDYQETQAANAEVVRERLRFSTNSGQILSVYKGHEAFRPVNVDANDTIWVTVDGWRRPAHLSSRGMRDLIVD